MTALDSIHRGVAVEIWYAYQESPLARKGLEQALGAFDLFVLHDQPQDIDYVGLMFVLSALCPPRSPFFRLQIP